MSNEQIDFQEVLALVEIIKASSNFSEIRLRSGNIEIELRRGGSSEEVKDGISIKTDQVENSKLSTKKELLTEEKNNKKKMISKGATIVKSPMVGVFYNAPEPNAAPFVKKGQTVMNGDQLCIIEVMKLMNSINAESTGIIHEIFVEDGDQVIFGQELFLILPN